MGECSKPYFHLSILSGDAFSERAWRRRAYVSELSRPTDGICTDARRQLQPQQAHLTDSTLAGCSKVRSARPQASRSRRRTLSAVR